MLGESPSHGVSGPSSVRARRYTDLEVWKNASDLRDQVNRLVNLPEFSQQAWLHTEMRRAAQAACAGIADGFGRQPSEFVRFVQASRTALTQLRDLIGQAVRLRLVTGTKAAGLGSLADSAIRSAASFIRDLERAAGHT
jgi:four helix bundle protein